MEKSMPIISVIIPVYNVEKYLCQCLDSVINQTYKNLEIILVDDGSTDDSGKICNEYAKRDRRIIVVHKNNGGLSDARNAGIDICKGEYVSFVDSDDWLDLDMYEIFISKIIEHNADIVSCGYVLEFANKKFNCNLANIIIDGNDKVLQNLFYNKNFPNAVWGKVYNKNIFEKLRFPIGKIYEDMLIKYDILKKSQKVVILKSTFYHYRQRSNSIMNDINIEKIKEKIAVCEIIIKKIKKENSLLLPQAYHQLYKHYISVTDDIVNLNISKEQKKYIINQIKCFIRKNIKNIIFNKTINFKAKIGFLLIATNARIFILIRKTFKKNLEMN